VIKVTKLDAARNQLSTAIELWFSEADHVSIYTLAYASHEIIHRIYRSQGRSDLMFDSKIIKDEHRGDFAKYIKAAPNFFKHASNETNQDDEIEFSDKLSELLIMASIVGLIRISESLNHSESAYMYWQRIHNPSWFSANTSESGNLSDNMGKLLGTDKSVFYMAYKDLKNKGLVTPEFTAK
jgi:hypothetical protein